MSTESLHRTPETNNETPMFNEGVLMQEHTLVIKPKGTSIPERTSIPKRTCVISLKQKLYNSQKKDKIKNRAIIFTIFFSVGIIGFIAG